MLAMSCLLIGGLIGFFVGGIIVSSAYKSQIRYGEVEFNGESYRTRKI